MRMQFAGALVILGTFGCGTVESPSCPGLPEDLPADWGVVPEGFDTETFDAEVVAAMAELEAAHPGRFRSFVADGDGHTFILRNFDREVGGTTPRRWIEDLLNGSAWVSVAD